MRGPSRSIPLRPILLLLAVSLHASPGADPLWSKAADGEVVTDVVRSVKNGKDNTAEDRKKDAKPQPFSMGDNPLDPGVQDRVVAKLGPGSRTIEDRPCVP
jgi:hypothetical protein